MAYGSFVLMRDLNFAINDGDVFIIMGGSGSGKSTLLRHLIGLNEPAQGRVRRGVGAPRLDGHGDVFGDARELLRHAVPPREHRVLADFEYATHGYPET